MTLVTRVGDIGSGSCPAHKGRKSYNTIFVPGQSTVLAEGSPVIRVGDVGLSTCGHPTVALMGAVTVFAVASNVHRVGDIGSNPGPYVTVIGATTVYANT